MDLCLWNVSRSSTRAVQFTNNFKGRKSTIVQSGHQGTCLVNSEVIEEQECFQLSETVETTRQHESRHRDAEKLYAVERHHCGARYQKSCDGDE